MKTTVYKNTDKILLAVDCIIFGFDGKDLKALLVKRAIEPEKGKWSLMGGFVKAEESVDAAATRVLSIQTGLDDIYMEQLYCFGEVDRDNAGRVVVTKEGKLTNAITIDISTLAKGVYFVKATDKSGGVSVGKMVVLK